MYVVTLYANFLLCSAQPVLLELWAAVKPVSFRSQHPHLTNGDASRLPDATSPSAPIAASTPLDPDANAAADAARRGRDLRNAVASDARLRSVAEKVCSKMDRGEGKEAGGAAVAGIVPTASRTRPATSVISIVAV